MDPGLLPTQWRIQVTVQVYTCLGVVLGFIYLFVYYMIINTSQASGYSHSYKIIPKREKKNLISLILKGFH